MVDIVCYIENLIPLLKEEFGERLRYVGLQGSYLREEATENSDIDIMLIIDDLSVSDLDAYRNVIQSLEHYEKSCGFICSREDLQNWNPLEICNLLHSTKDCYGVLEKLMPAYSERDIRNFIKFSLNNLYHEICHRYIHADIHKNEQNLPFSYKGVFFILQNLYYLRCGEFVMKREELLPLLDGKDHAVLLRSMDMSAGREFAFRNSFELLFSWCQETLLSL